MDKKLFIPCWKIQHGKCLCIRRICCMFILRIKSILIAKAACAYRVCEWAGMHAKRNHNLIISCVSIILCVRLKSFLPFFFIYWLSLAGWLAVGSYVRLHKYHPKIIFWCNYLCRNGVHTTWLLSWNFSFFIYQHTQLFALVHFGVCMYAGSHVAQYT